MSGHRSHFRNVRFFDEANPDVVLGGLVQNGSITERNFLTMLDIVFVTTAPIRVSAKDTGKVVSMVGTRLDVRDYLVSCEDEIQVSDEPWVHRITSHSVSGREDAFRDGIRARDNKCVISGRVHRNPHIWTSFEAAHVFPLEKESLWIQFNYGQPLDPVCRDPTSPRCVSDQLLRWHFRQSVLANMRGAGEPAFEHDFLPGMDMMKEIREKPLAQERLELELSYRLRQVV
ncbi:hypothetical protein FPQ18DRAFT_365613 [Pyronema domesticum]|nr:hypothetical protein FPQ18DRAFT_365613 [Pyronema domesticum]